MSKVEGQYTLECDPMMYCEWKWAYDKALAELDTAEERYEKAA